MNKEMLLSNINKIHTTEMADYSMLTIVILSAGIAVKFILGIYVKKKGEEVHSDSLVASGSDPLMMRCFPFLYLYQLLFI